MMVFNLKIVIFTLQMCPGVWSSWDGGTPKGGISINVSTLRHWL